MSITSAPQTVLFAPRLATPSAMRLMAGHEQALDLVGGGQRSRASHDAQRTLGAALVALDGRLAVEHVGNVLSGDDSNDHLGEGVAVDVWLLQQTLGLGTDFE